MEGGEEEEVPYDDDEEQADVEDDEDMGLGSMQARCLTSFPLLHAHHPFVMLRGAQCFPVLRT